MVKRIELKKKFLAFCGLVMLMAGVLFVGLETPQAQATPAAPADILPTITLVPPSITLITTKTKTITVTLPRKTATKTVVRHRRVVTTATQYRTVVRTAPAKPAVTRTVNRVQMVPQPVQTSRITVTAKPVTKTVKPPTVVRTKVVDDTKIVSLTKVKAASISIGLVIVGAILGVITILTMYALGYLDADRKNKEFLEDMLDQSNPDA